MISSGQCHASTVLLVESEPDVAHTLSLILTATGYNVILASLGHEAIEKANSSVDLVLLDLTLWDMEGVEVCHYLRQSEQTRSVPIIALSGKTGWENEKVQCLQLGADDYIDQPVTRDDLLRRVESLIAVHHSKNFHPLDANGRVMELKRIVEQELIQLNFQPIYFLEPMKLLGVEVLTRPQTESPLKNPEFLFETAEACGLYFDLEMMAWKKALNIFEKVGQDQRLFLNCSPRLVENNHFTQVQHLFTQSRVDASSVFFELTERSAVVHPKLFYQRLHQYRDIGFKIAVDDVGSGFSSLETIVETRPEVVKIDRHIVHELSCDPYKKSIVKFIVSFCREHDIICVAEGVETKEELQILKNLNVNACQGFYFCRPAAELDILAFQSIIP